MSKIKDWFTCTAKGISTWSERGILKMLKEKDDEISDLKFQLELAKRSERKKEIEIRDLKFQLVFAENLAADYVSELESVKEERDNLLDEYMELKKKIGDE